MELLDILDKLDKESEMAARNPADFPVVTRDGWLVRIAQAKKKVEELKVLYAQTFFNESVPLLLSGSSVKEIGSLLESYESGVYVHADDLYEGIADQLEKHMGPQRLWLVDMTNSLNHYLAQIMADMGAASFVRVVPDRNSFAIKDRAHLGQLVKAWVVKYNGQTPSLFYLCRKIREKALKARLAGESYVLVEGLTTDESMEWAALFKKPSTYEVDLNGDPKEDLSGVLKRYQEGLKSTKSKKKNTGRG